MIWKSPVSSKMIMTAVIGARAAAANTAPIPTRPYAPAATAMPGSRLCAAAP